MRDRCEAPSICPAHAWSDASAGFVGTGSLMPHSFFIGMISPPPGTRWARLSPFLGLCCGDEAGVVPSILVLHWGRKAGGLWRAPPGRQQHRVRPLHARREWIDLCKSPFLISLTDSCSSPPLEQWEAEGMGLTMSCLWDLQRGGGGMLPPLTPPGAGPGTQSLRVCQSPGGGRDEFPGLLAGCLPPSAHLLLSQMFSSFFLLPPSMASSSYASPVCGGAGDVGCRRGVGGCCGREDGGTDPGPCSPDFPPDAEEREEGAFGPWLGGREDVA